MLGRVTSVVGVDLGSESIKIAEIKIKGKRPKITAVGMVSTPKGAINATGVIKFDLVKEALRSLFSEAKVSSKHAVVSIVGQASVVVRMLQVPSSVIRPLIAHSVDSNKLGSYVEGEIKKINPFGPSEIVSDYFLFEPRDPSAPQDLLLAIALESSAQMFSRLISDLGKKPLGLDVEALAFSRSLKTSLNQGIADKANCFIDIGKTKTSIVLLHGGQLLMQRQIPFGGEEMTRLIAEKMHYDWEQAEEFKRQEIEITDKFWDRVSRHESLLRPGGISTELFSPSEGSGFSTSLSLEDSDHLFEPRSELPLVDPKESLSDFSSYVPYNPFAMDVQSEEVSLMASSEDLSVEEQESLKKKEEEQKLAAEKEAEVTLAHEALRGVLDEMVDEIRRSIEYTKHYGSGMSKIYLGGGGSNMRGLCFYFEKATGVPCEIYDPTSHLHLALKRESRELLLQHKREFSVAIGNALYALY